MCVSISLVTHVWGQQPSPKWKSRNFLFSSIRLTLSRFMPKSLSILSLFLHTVLGSSYTPLPGTWSCQHCKHLPLTYAAPLEWELHTKTLLFVYSRLFSELLGPETGELPGSQPFGRGFCVYSRSTLPFSEVQSHSHEAAKSSGKQQQLFPTLPLGGRYFPYFQGSTNRSASLTAKAPWASGWAEC